MTSFAGRRVLVTGGAGFVGCALASRLSASGAEVCVLDDLSTGSADVVPDGVTLVRGSVADRGLVDDLVAEHPLIFHLAARGLVASTLDPLTAFETNVTGTLNLLLAARKNRLERLIYASSASIYGNSNSLPISEDEPPVSLSPYAAAKLSGEQYCLGFRESYSVPSTVIRYSNVYGPGQQPDNPYAGVVTKFLSRATDRRPLLIHGDGQQTRDFTFIDDAVEATLAASAHPQAEGEVFNVGTGIETSVLELVRALGLLLNIRPRVEHVEPRDVDHIHRRAVNVEKIRRMLHWSPRTTLEEGLRRTAEDLRAVGVPPAYEDQPSDGRRDALRSGGR